MTAPRLWPLVATTIVAASAAHGGQALYDSAAIPQPHLAKARAYAAQQRDWRHPGVGVCYWDDGEALENMARDVPARRIADHLYFVGSGALGVWAFDTADGIVLIDAMNNREEVERFVLPGLRRVGLDPARLKVLIVSHGHADHFGGAQFLKERYGVRVYMSDADWLIAPRQRLREGQEATPARDATLVDGQMFRFGGLALRVLVTPGHTPGSLAMLIPATDRGRPVTLLYVSGISNKNLTPALHAAFDRSYDRLIHVAAAAKVDGYIASHPSFDDAIMKLEWMRANPALPNPFLIGTRETLLFLKEVRECNLNAADLHRAMPDRRTSARVDRE